MPEGPSIVILREETAKFVGQVVREVGGNSRQDIQRMAISSKGASVIPP